MVVFGNQAYLRIGLSDFSEKDKLVEAIGAIKYDPKKKSNTAAGLLKMTEEFESEGRGGAGQIAVVITDGKSSNKEAALAMAEDAQTVGIVIYGIGTKNYNEEELRMMSSPPREKTKNYFVSPTFETLEDIYDRVTVEICGGAEEETVQTTTTTKSEGRTGSTLRTEGTAASTPKTTETTTITTSSSSSIRGGTETQGTTEPTTISALKEKQRCHLWNPAYPILVS